MATGLQRLVRRALLTRLKANSDLTALVPAASIHTQAIAGEPTWPFIKLGAPVTLPLKASGVRGGNVATDLHVFARSRVVSGVLVETAEDHASRIGAEVEALTDGVNIDLENGAKARLRLSDIHLLQDEEPDAFHWFAQCNARVLAR